MKQFDAQRAGISAALISAVLLSAVMTGAHASHIGEDITVDQQAVTSTNQLLGALRQYETADLSQRPAALQRLVQLAANRREQMLALIERNPKIAALRVLPAAVRNRLPAQAQVEREVSVTGVVQASIADDFSRGRSTKRFEVLDAAGQRFELRFAEATEREMLAMVGKRASIAAVQIDRQLLVLDKRRVQLLAAGGTATTTTTTATTTPSVIQGDQSTLVIMANFTDKVIECTASDVQTRLFGSTGATTNVGYQQSSGGLVSFSGKVIGPVNINYSSTGTCDYNGWASAANAAAIAAGINPSSYMRVSYALPRNSNCGWLGLGALGGAMPSPTWTQQCTSTGLFSHELGHNLNFHHAATPGTEYGDGSDPMGAAKLVQSNAANRVMAGWVSGSRLQDVSNAGSYAISAMESTAPSGAQVLRLSKPDTAEYYYVSLRQPAGIDTNLWTIYQNMVTVHKSTGTLPAYTYLLATLDAGQTWTDSINGIQVTNQGVSGSSATVAVGFGGSTCTRQAPTLSAAPASQTATPGTTVAYALSVTNNNSAACTSATFNVSQSLPAGFTGSLGATSLTLAAGATASVAWNVTTSTTSTDGIYTVNADVGEATVINTATTHAAYTVLAAPPPPTTDTTPPIVSITSPVASAVIATRLITLSALATDNVGVAKVEFYVDGNLIATDTGAPYSANWNTRKATRGTHWIKARAIDGAGNAAEQTISVTLN